MLQSVLATSCRRRSQFTSSKLANAPLLQRVKLTLAWYLPPVLVTESRHREKIGSSGTNRNIYSASGFNSRVNWNKAGYTDRNNSPVRDKYRSNLRKKVKKYQGLVEQCTSNKWRTTYFPIEVSCRVFARRSVYRILSRLGMIGKKKKGHQRDFRICWKKLRDSNGLKDQIHEAQKRQRSVEKLKS